MTAHDILSDAEYNKAFDRGAKTALDGKLIVIDDFLYRVNLGVYKDAVKMMEDNHDEGVSFLVKNSTLLTPKRIESFNS